MVSLWEEHWHFCMREILIFFGQIGFILPDRLFKLGESNIPPTAAPGGTLQRIDRTQRHKIRVSRIHTVPYCRD